MQIQRMIPEEQRRIIFKRFKLWTVRVKEEVKHFVDKNAMPNGTKRDITKEQEVRLLK